MNGIVDIMDIKTGNTKSVLNTLRFSDQLTKKDIALHTCLSFATVSNLCNELKSANVICNFKKEQKSVGRKPNSLSLNFDHFCILALDMQLEYTLGLAILNLKNDIIWKDSYDISNLTKASEILKFAKEAFDKIIELRHLNEVEFIGVGAAVPAVYDSDTSTLSLSAIAMFEQVPLKQMLGDAFGMMPYVDNIANIRALSVHTRFPEMNNIVCLDVSQGVGVGAISEGNLIRGKHGYATEVAHVPIGDPNLLCPVCGGTGCVELELSLEGMLHYSTDLLHTDSLIHRWNYFVKLLSESKLDGREFAEHIGTLLGKLASILINLFDPEVFFITGYITDVFDILAPYFQQQLSQRCKLALQQGLKIQVEKQDSCNSDVFIGLSDAVYNRWEPLR